MNVFDYFFEFSKGLTKDFVLGPKEKINYPELFKQSKQLAVYINSLTEEQEKILLFSPNSVFFIISYLAILKSGRICVPINPDIEPANLDFIIEQCNARFILIHPNYEGRYSLGKLKQIVPLQENLSLKDFPIDNNFNEAQCAEIIFTSGSTGIPKGVMLSHRNIIANTNSIIKYLDLTQDDIIEVVMPFYYCYGLSLLHTHLRAGGSVVLNNTFVFIGSVLNDLNTYKCTGFAGVPSHFQILLRKSESFKTSLFPSLRYVTQAGGKLHDVFIKEFLEYHPELKLFVMYGQTEATARLSYLPPEKLPEKTGSIGCGIPGVELKVINTEGNEVKPGETGEIVARGENIMMGYFNDKKSTDETIRDNWLHTGDLASIDDDGYLYIQARQKEIIKVSGKRISPKEIEEIIVSIPEVIDCTITAFEDELLGEGIKAKITIDKQHQENINADFIRQYCSTRLASYKIPQVIEIADKIIISATGKKIKAQN